MITMDEAIPSSLAMSSVAEGNTLGFPFFSLPTELRSKILLYLVAVPQPVDLNPDNHRAGHQRLNLFLTSHRLHAETSRLFYSSHTFRIFPTHGRFFAPKTVPLLARLPNHYRESLVSLELRLGPGWSNPPKSWWVDSRLGLEKMKNVRTVRVFVEVDPSHDTFKGFRLGKHFFTDFAAHLLEEIICRLPALTQIVFDSWPSVRREGPLMKRLVNLTQEHGKHAIEMQMQNPCDHQEVVASLRKIEELRID